MSKVPFVHKLSFTKNRKRVEEFVPSQLPIRCAIMAELM
jgi:hypothetical protein